MVTRINFNREIVNPIVLGYTYRDEVCGTLYFYMSGFLSCVDALM